MVIENKIKEMQEIAKKRGGKCLSNEYFNCMKKLRWQCEKGHVWEARLNDIKRGTWCPVCFGKQKLTIEKMQEIAKERGGKLLSKNYITIGTKVKWQCSKGHVFESTPNDIKGGHWCPRCGGTGKLTIKEMKEIAQDRGGKCLSNKYVNGKTKLKWQCKEGHIWEARPSNIKIEQWCPICSGNIPSNIEEMQKIAEERGGRCLSEKYINNKTKLEWQCEEGHVWEATPGSIKNSDTWCPVCARKRK